MKSIHYAYIRCFSAIKDPSSFFLDELSNCSATFSSLVADNEKLFTTWFLTEKRFPWKRCYDVFLHVSLNDVDHLQTHYRNMLSNIILFYLINLNIKYFKVQTITILAVTVRSNIKSMRFSTYAIGDEITTNTACNKLRNISPTSMI